MEKVFQIATNISTPLALGGFIVAVLFYIFRRILSSDLVPKVKRDQGYKIIMKIINFVFILALVGMVLGFVSSFVPKVMAYYYPELKQGYIDVGTDQDVALEDLINLVSKQKNVTIIFTPNCDSSVRKAML